MRKNYFLKKITQQKPIGTVLCVMISILISFAQDSFDKQKSWKIIIKDKSTNTNKILTDTFFIELKANNEEKSKILKYTSNGFIVGLEKKKGISYTISIFNDYYEKRILTNVEQYLYKPIIVKMNPIYVKVNIAVKNRLYWIDNNYPILKHDSFTLKKSTLPVKYPIAPLLDTTYWAVVEESNILRLNENELHSNKPLTLHFDVGVTRKTKIQEFNINIEEVISSKPPNLYYDIIGFHYKDTKLKEKLPENVLRFKAQWPNNPLKKDHIKLIFYNTKNYFFSNSVSPAQKPWIADICTMAVNEPLTQYSIKLNQLPDFDFIYIASYKLEKRMRWFEYLSTLLNDIQGNDYFLYLSNNTIPVYSDNRTNFKPVIQKLLENEYDPPDVAFDMKKITSIVNFDELIPQRRAVTFRFFFTNYISDKTIESIIQPIIKKIGPLMQYVKIYVYCPDKKEFDLIKNLSDSERKNVFVKVF